MDLLQLLKANKHDIVVIQELHIDFLGQTCANPYWMVIYPRQHLNNPKKTRSVILVNCNISMNNWEDLNIDSSNVTGVHLHGVFGAICILNVYNNCMNNGSLRVVEEFMRRRQNRLEVRNRMGEKVLWLGDFNRHHPLWDEERNVHLFTKATLEAAQPLIDMISEHDIHMVLPKDIPTLEACLTKNFTRVNNIFCTENLIDCVISCNTYPHWCPQKTDHLLVISVLEIELEEAIQITKFNYRSMDWEEFRKSLENNLAEMLVVEEITSEEDLYDHIAKLNSAIKATFKDQVPLNKLSPYGKRWWTKDLSSMKKQKQ